jgi:hypothetical protein
MIEIQFEAPSRRPCQCCGRTATTLTRFVVRDGEPFAIYYAGFSECQPTREVKLAVSIGEWGNRTGPEDRCAFALRLGRQNGRWNVAVMDASDSPWRHVEIIGRMLDRDHALVHESISDVFHLTDHIVNEDEQVRAFFEL